MVNTCIRLPAEQVLVSGCLHSRSYNHREYGLVTLREYGLTVVREYGLAASELWTLAARYIELACEVKTAES